MREITAKAGQELFIGKRGENNAVCVVFDISDWQALYGAGNVQLIHQRNGDKIPYPCPVEVSGGAALWVITKTDVGNPGVGRAELQYWVGDAIVKSEIFSTKTARSMGDAGEEPPAPATTWLEKMQQLGIDTEENAEAAEASAQVAAASAASAKASETSAATSARNAAASETSVAANAQSAKTSAESAANSAAIAEAANSEIAASKATAETAARSANDSATAAAQSAAEAKTSENNAASSATAAAGSAQSANAAREAVASSASAAASSANAAAQSATNAGASEKNAADSEEAAKNAADNAAAAVERKLSGYVTDAEAAEAGAIAAQKAAEDARDAASEIVGGDFASKTEAKGYANAAESNANKYTDQKIAAIPAPDVSGQISEHDASGAAHSDIRSAIPTKASDLNAPTIEEMNAAIAAIPAPESDVFYAQYGITTYAEIKEAYSKGKSVYAVKDNSVYTMSDMWDTFGVFTYMTSTGAGYQELRMVTYAGDTSTGIYTSDSNHFAKNISELVNDAGFMTSVIPSGQGIEFLTPGTAKGRLFTLANVPDWAGWTLNAKFTDAGWVLDNPSIHGWFLKLDCRAAFPEFALYYIPPGAGAHIDESIAFAVKSDGTVVNNYISSIASAASAAQAAANGAATAASNAASAAATAQSTANSKEASGTAAGLINRATAVNVADTNYTTLMARGTSLNSAETTPGVNGAIAWTYK